MTRQALACNARAVLAAAMIAAALALPEAAVASMGIWDGINRDFGKLLLYLDQASITREGHTDKAWLLFDFLDAQPMPIGFKRYQSVKALVAVDCADRTYAREKEIKYSGPHASGPVISTYAWKRGEQQFEKAVPFTNSQAIVDSVCHTATARLKSGAGVRVTEFAIAPQLSAACVLREIRLLGNRRSTN